MELEERLRDHLRTVIDPEMGLNVVELGLIYNISTGPEEVMVDFTLTSPFCPMGEAIRGDIIKAVGEILPSARVTANIVWSPPWDPEYLSDEIKLYLGYPL